MHQRTAIAAAGVDLSGVGLEVGPSVETRLLERGVEFIDADRVLRGDSVVEAVGREGAFDFVIASHVIERTVDLVGFLQDCARLLKPGGRLALVVPDARFFFDVFKPLSSVGSVVDAHLRPTSFHPAGCVIDNLPVADLASGRDAIAAGIEQAEYLDRHRWLFTPSSFSLLVQDLGELGLHSFVEVAAEPTVVADFFVTLEKAEQVGPKSDRALLLRRVQRELVAVDDDYRAATARIAELETTPAGWGTVGRGSIRAAPRVLRDVGRKLDRVRNRLDGGRTRASRALKSIDRKGVGLEIGPSYNPLLPKSSGARVEVLDHASRAELYRKYEALQLPRSKLEKIEEVDHLWRGGSLVDAVGRESAFDFVIASHVIEHTVDLVGFLQDCERLLKPGGRLALVVPDKRFCFDMFKPLSSVGSVVDAHLRPTQFHPAGCLIDNLALLCTRGGSITWSEGATGPVALQAPDLGSGPDLIAQGVAQAEYLDRHRWIFTPSSFSLLVQDLAELGLHSFVEVSAEPTVGFEFFVTLEKSDSVRPRWDRALLLRRVQRELVAVDDDYRAAMARIAELETTLPKLRQR